MIPQNQIAVLGFGSLPNQLQNEATGKTLHALKPPSSAPMPAGSRLNPDSPFVPTRLALPIRMGRISGQDTANRRITLVLQEGASDEPVFYTLSKMPNLQAAIRDLQEREGCPTSRHIGYVDLVSNTSNGRLREVVEKIAAWGRHKGFQAVIWTDLPEKGIPFRPGSTGREILPVLANDPILLANTQRYIRSLAVEPNRLQRMVLEMQPSEQMHFFMKWPNDPRPLGMTREEMRTVDDFLKCNYEALKNSKRDFKKGIPYTLNGRTWRLPCALVFLEGGLPIIHPKNVPPVGRGGERIAKSAYCPLNGEFLVKKRILVRAELALAKHLLRNCPKGIAPTVGIRKVQGEEGIKYQLYEKRYDTSLDKFLNENTPTHDQKMGMIKGLLEALRHVHKIPYEYCEDDYSSDWEETNLREDYGVERTTHRHGDIKEENILIRRGANGIEAALSDFGCSDPGQPGNQFHLSPEDCGACEDNGYHPDCFKEPSDVWSMGLLIGNILKENHSPQEMLPLKCLDRLVQAWNQNPMREGRFLFIDYPQGPIDTEIASLIRSCGNDRSGRQKSRLWNLVNQMLQVDKRKRISLDNACKEINAILQIA